MPDPPAAPSGRDSAEGPDANREIFSGYGFPGYPDLTHLCGRRDLLPGGERLVWDAFSSGQTPVALVAHFKRYLSERGFSGEKSGGSWRLPPGSPAPQRTLSITPPSAIGKHKGCPSPPAAEAKSVVILTRR